MSAGPKSSSGVENFETSALKYDNPLELAAASTRADFAVPGGPINKQCSLVISESKIPFMLSSRSIKRVDNS